jgi:hypothetical protein
VAEESPEKKALFELDVVEGPMTSSQLRSILDYVGDAKVGEVVDGARDVKDAMGVLEGAEGSGRVKRPIVSLPWPVFLIGLWFVGEVGC